MIRIPESGTYELVKETKDSRIWELPAGAIIVSASTRLSGGSALMYLKPVGGGEEQ